MYLAQLFPIQRPFAYGNGKGHRHTVSPHHCFPQTRLPAEKPTYRPEPTEIFRKLVSLRFYDTLASGIRMDTTWNVDLVGIRTDSLWNMK